MDDSNVELVKTKKKYRSNIVICDDSNESQRLKVIYEKILSVDLPAPKFNLQSLSEYERNFYHEKIEKSLVEVVSLCEKTVKQGDTFWKEERRFRITASKAYNLYTYAFNKQADWSKNIKNYINDSFKGTADTRYGILMEESAFKCYERYYDISLIKAGLLVNPSIPWLGFSPDALVPDSFIVEFKSSKIGKTMTANEAAKKLPYLIERNNNYFLKKRHMYYCQVQLGMFITNLRFCHFIIYCSFNDSIFLIEVPYNENLVLNYYLPVLQNVYFKYILPNCVIYKQKQEAENNGAIINL